MFRRAAEAVVQRASYLSELDMVGDADFGVSVSKGFTLAVERLSREDDPDVGRVLAVAGETFSMEVGSTIGALFGSALTEAGKAMEGRKTLDAGGLATILEAMLAAVKTAGGAAVGDKTLLDALEPAALAADAAASEEDGGLGRGLAAAASAAEAGSDSTAGMVARVGRASYLGERSRGRVDPGAAFIALFLRSMSRVE